MSTNFLAAAAHLMIDQYGWSAVSVAGQRVHEARVAGDKEGEATWLSIMDVILEIGRTVQMSDSEGGPKKPPPESDSNRHLRPAAIAIPCEPE